MGVAATPPRGAHRAPSARHRNAAPARRSILERRGGTERAKPQADRVGGRREGRPRARGAARCSGRATGRRNPAWRGCRRSRARSGRSPARSRPRRRALRARRRPRGRGPRCSRSISGARICRGGSRRCDSKSSRSRVRGTEVSRDRLAERVDTDDGDAPGRRPRRPTGGASLCPPRASRRRRRVPAPTGARRGGIVARPPPESPDLGRPADRQAAPAAGSPAPAAVRDATCRRKHARVGQEDGRARCSLVLRRPTKPSPTSSRGK